MKQIASGKLLYSTGNLAQCSVMTWRGVVGWGVVGWGGWEVKEGGDVYIQLTHFVVQQKLTQGLKQLYTNRK